jgi:NAD(P)-dependent dehydrogenase (short-subunit alcohol dehydrogenase family)
MTTWLITGCSTGLGRALAEAVLARGDEAVVTARDAAAVQDLVDDHPHRSLGLPLDVTDPVQIAAVAQQAESRFGGVDVLVNNAGYGYHAAIEEGDEADVDRMFQTNFFGAIAMTKAVLPAMRARRRGAIVNISSIGARLCPVGLGYYAASKAALEAATSALRQEVQPLGITAFTVEPGAFRTDFAGRSLIQSREVIADYDETAGKIRKMHDTTNGKQPGDPAKAADAIIAAVEDIEPPELLLLGSDAATLVAAAVDRQRAEIEKWAKLSVSTDYV